MDTDKPIPRVELSLFGARRRLNQAEAIILEELLMLEWNSAARKLAVRITAASITGGQVNVDNDEFRALCGLMSVTDVGENLGLVKLKETCASLSFLVSDDTIPGRE